MQYLASDYEQLRKAVGKSISAVNRGDFLIDGAPNDDDLGPLELVFDDGSALHLSLVSDGESIRFDWHESPPTHLVAQNSEWERVYLSQAPPYSHAIGGLIATVDLVLFGVVGQAERVVAGCVFRLSTNHHLVYYNAGDFAKIYIDEMPPCLGAEFELRVIPLSST